MARPQFGAVMLFCVYYFYWVGPVGTDSQWLKLNEKKNPTPVAIANPSHGLPGSQLLSRRDPELSPTPYCHQSLQRPYRSRDSWPTFSTCTDLEWKLVYVGSAEDETYDQVLESVLVGPVNVGTFRFIFETDPPDSSKIRDEDILGVTVLLLTCSYAGQEFLRIGYYVNNDYEDEQLREEPPQKVLIDRVQRNILADKPRVTKFPINFHPEICDNGAEQAQDTLFEEQLTEEIPAEQSTEQIPAEQALPPSEQSFPPSEQSLPPPEQTPDRT